MRVEALHLYLKPCDIKHYSCTVTHPLFQVQTIVIVNKIQKQIVSFKSAHSDVFMVNVAA